MALFDWFTFKNKKNNVIPLVTGPVTGVALILAFTTKTEPKLIDFPKEKYKCYWETLIDTVSGGYGAIVRFYEFGGTGVMVSEHRIARQSVQELKKEVDLLILDTMAKNKR